MSGYDRFDELVDCDPLALRDLARNLAGALKVAQSYIEADDGTAFPGVRSTVLGVTRHALDGL